MRSTKLTSRGSLSVLLTTALLGLFLSSLPHDHELDQTHNLNLPRPLCWLLGNGHLHLAHHTFARVPWYRLPGVWREYQQSILSNDPSSRVSTCR